MASHSAHPSRRLVGRDAQLVVATAHLDDLGTSRGALLVLGGEPGIGKTRLAEEIVTLGRDRGTRTAWATSWQGEGAPPLWPWTQVLRALGGSEVALEAFTAESPGASAAARFAQCEAIVGFVRRAAEHDPIVIVIDDLQWADAASVRILTSVAEQLRQVACLIVATYRTDEFGRESLADLARVGVSLTVPSLPDAAAGELLRASVGAGVSPDVADAIVARSGGNPLFVWEFGQLLANGGRAAIAPGAIPDAVVAVIERRLARVTESVLTLLRAGAVAGNPFTAREVAAMTDASVDDAVVGLDSAVADGVLTPTDPVIGYRFSHDLIRDVVLDGIAPLRRAELHLQAASAYAQRLRADDAFHAVVADHLEQAGPAHAEAAASHWELAARRARRVLAFDQAAVCFARSHRNWTVDPRHRAELLVAEGEALLMAGDLEYARDRFTEAAKGARELAEPDLLARAVLGIGSGPVAWEVPIADDEQTALIAAALDLLPGHEATLRSMLLARLSVAAATPETVDLARRRSTEALELAQAVGDPALIAQALAAVNDAFAGPAHTMTRRDNADAIVELAMAAGDRVLELLGYRYRIVADLEVGDIAAVDRNITAFARLASQLRQPLVSWYVPLFRGMRALLAGDVDDADGRCGEVAEAAQATGSLNAKLMALTLRMGIDSTRDATVEPTDLAGLVDVDPAEFATLAAGMGMLCLRSGDTSRARALLKLHADNAFARLGEDGEHLTTLLLFGRIAVALDETPTGAAVYDLLSPYAGLWAVDGIAGCCWGPVDLELGRLAMAVGRTSTARDHLAQARAAAEAAGAPLIVEEAETLAAQCHRRDHDDAPRAAPTGADVGDVFRLDGQFWTLSYRGRTVRMKDAKGLQDLARLLAAPGREIHVLDLAGTRADPTVRALGQAGDLGEMLDARARAEYRRRLAELEDDVDDAERCADLARAEKARAERDFIAAELAGALGLGGRPRRAGDPSDRARKAVAGRIRLTIGRLEEIHPDLARHLTNAVRTGTFCVYHPEDPVDWVV